MKQTFKNNSNSFVSNESTNPAKKKKKKKVKKDNDHKNLPKEIGINNAVSKYEQQLK